MANIRNVVTAGVPEGEIGGGQVRRPFAFGNGRIGPGTNLSAEQIATIRPVNLRCLVEQGSLVIWPRAARGPAHAAPEGAKRHIVQVGFGSHVRYDVIEGVRLNEGPLSKEEAERLAAEPVSAPGAAESKAA